MNVTGMILNVFLFLLFREIQNALYKALDFCLLCKPHLLKMQDKEFYCNDVFLCCYLNLQGHFSEESKSEQTFSSVKPNKICIHTTGLYLYLQPLGFGLTSYSYKRFIDYYHVDQPKTWTDAQKYCREKYTDLLSIESNDDLRLMNSVSVPTTWSWIGLNPWRWSDRNSNSSFRNWEAIEPNSEGQEHCVAENSQRYWADGDCHLAYFFWCYKGEISHEYSPAGKTPSDK
uniref:C-type lectin domain-containing protein n=1 Tax=Echeneis naucrates TaxID=173247 RepID=A0A665UHQ8_ECHNA